MKPTDLILYRSLSLQVTLPLGALARPGLDEKVRGEVVAALARLLLEAARPSSAVEVDDDAA